MKHNTSRTERFRRKPTQELKKICESGSLASAAAAYELKRRGEALITVPKEEDDGA